MTYEDIRKIALENRARKQASDIDGIKDSHEFDVGAVSILDTHRRLQGAATGHLELVG